MEEPAATTDAQPEDATFATIVVAGDRAQTPLRVTVQGITTRIPFNSEHAVSPEVLEALRNSDTIFEIISRHGVVADAGEMNDAAAAGGTGGGVVPDTIEGTEGSAITDDVTAEPAGPSKDHAELLLLLDGNVKAVANGLAGRTADELAALLAAEQGGKTRATVIAAIEAAIAALAPTETEAPVAG